MTKLSVHHQLWLCLLAKVISTREKLPQLPLALTNGASIYSSNGGANMNYALSRAVFRKKE
jgi:hypothetical protein